MKKGDAFVDVLLYALLESDVRQAPGP